MANRYSVILADPPWQYGAWSGKESRTADSHYPLMTDSEIAELAVPNICARDCALFLWATPPKIGSALRVLHAWGFEYKTFGLVWLKVNRGAAETEFEDLTDADLYVGMGHHTRANVEVALLGTRGRLARVSAAVRQPIVAPVGRHSAKPVEQYDRIEKLYGDVSRIELFARGKARDGWRVWGNEAAA